MNLRARLASTPNITLAPCLTSEQVEKFETQHGVKLPDDYRVSLANSGQPGAYPISSFTYLLINGQPKNCEKSRILLHLLYWMYNDPKARDLATTLEFAPLPEDVRDRVNETIRGITCDGATVLPGEGSTS